MCKIKVPCADCHMRKEYAKYYDVHFWGDDCPYDCERYKKFAEYSKCFNDEQPAELKCKECPFRELCKGG